MRPSSAPATIAAQKCGTKTPCEWLAWLHANHTEATFAALGKEGRIKVIRSHARHHSGETDPTPKFRKPK